MEEAEEEVETEVDDDDGHGVDVIPVKKRESGRAFALFARLESVRHTGIV